MSTNMIILSTVDFSWIRTQGRYGFVQIIPRDSICRKATIKNQNIEISKFDNS